ncbi:MAG: hypothetical protein HY852_04465 [Bradyrhizobium sp.]|nr:hypothetical protein [Bradyrhizobium sp.]
MRLGRTTLVALAVFAGCAAAAHAAPPTVVPSPGYDARLQEQRAASHARTTPATPANPPVVHRHAKRKSRH